MIGFAGIVWRLVFEGQDATRPVQSPEGRFHHSGQSALYTSLTQEGTQVAIKRYRGPDDPPRVMFPLHVASDRVADLRGNPDASIVWQNQRDTGQWATTWDFSDEMRAAGAEAMLYSSRSRPDLTHLVLFARPSKIVKQVGTPVACP